MHVIGVRSVVSVSSVISVMPVMRVMVLVNVHSAMVNVTNVNHYCYLSYAC